jgi:hypothetical protein
MRVQASLALLCVLGPLSLACFENRPIVLGGTAGIGILNGTAGAGGSGNPTGGVAGAAGTAMPGTSGTTGSAGTGCDIATIFGGAGQQPGKYYCTLAGACHDSQGAAGSLDMLTPGWEQKLVGTFPSSKGQVPSECLGSSEPYLIAGSSPARGLFLDKLDANPPCGARMPNLGTEMSPEDRACVQSWANALTAAAAGTVSDSGVTTAKGCDVSQLVTVKYACTIVGACHDAARSATGLDMVSAGWEQRLVGTLPSNGSQSAILSMCLGVNEPYLIAGTLPARGLFLDKLKAPPPCGERMPNLGSVVSPADMDCFQRWANALTSP